MKPQDSAFLIVLFILLLIKRFRSPMVFTISGLICLALAIPLFAFWIFFTAQHVVWYAAGFFLVAITLFFVQNKK